VGEALAHFHSILDLLGEKERTVFFLRHVEGLPLAEVVQVNVLLVQIRLRFPVRQYQRIPDFVVGKRLFFRHEKLEKFSFTNEVFDVVLSNAGVLADPGDHRLA
jgi:hypothetical protein